MPEEFHDCSWVVWSRHCSCKGARRVEERKKERKKEEENEDVVYLFIVFTVYSINMNCNFDEHMLPMKEFEN